MAAVPAPADSADDYEELYGVEHSTTASGQNTEQDAQETTMHTGTSDPSATLVIPGLGSVSEIPVNASVQPESRDSPIQPEHSDAEVQAGTGQAPDSSADVDMQKVGERIDDTPSVPHAAALIPPTGATTPAVIANSTETANAAESTTTAESTNIAENTTGAESANPKQSADAEFIEAAEAMKDNPEAEWQIDSSDEDTSSSDSDSDPSSSDDSDADGDYEMLDPATAAKMLMAEGGGDDEDGPSVKTGDKAGLKTKNEVEEQVIPKPDVTITEQMKLIPLGKIENVVENLALIKGYHTGEYQVLEPGSVLCKEDRSIIGAVAETFGRVQEPLYSVAFTNKTEIEEAGITAGLTIFYVEEHSTFVFTQPLRNLRGTDASNLHDEEIGDDEVEFSDDEAERAHKQAVKQAKNNRKAGARDVDAAPGAFHSANSDRKIISYDDSDGEASQQNSGPQVDSIQNGRNQRGTFERGRGRGGRGRGFGRGRDHGHHGRDDRSGGGYQREDRMQQRAAPYPSLSGPSASTSGGPMPQPPSSASFVPPAGNTFVPPPPGWPNPSAAPGQNASFANGWQGQAQYAQYQQQPGQPYQAQQAPNLVWPQAAQHSGQQYGQHFAAQQQSHSQGYGAQGVWGQQGQSGQQPAWPIQGQNQAQGTVPPPPPPNYQALLQHMEFLRQAGQNQQQ